MPRTRLLVSAAALGLVAASSLGSGVSAQGRQVSVSLMEQNGSTVMGTATLTDMGNGTTQVDINVSVETAALATQNLGLMQGGPGSPAHIHEGSCATLNPAPKYPLSPVMGSMTATAGTAGMSMTVVNASLAQIQGSQMAINVHKSPQEGSVYIACGDIAVAGAQAAPAAAAPAQVPMAAAPAAAPAQVPMAAAPAAAPAQVPARLPNTGDAAAIGALIGAAGATLTGFGFVLRRRFRR